MSSRFDQWLRMMNLQRRLSFCTDSLRPNVHEFVRDESWQYLGFYWYDVFVSTLYSSCTTRIMCQECSVNSVLHLDFPWHQRQKPIRFQLSSCCLIANDKNQREAFLLQWKAAFVVDPVKAGNSARLQQQRFCVCSGTSIVGLTLGIVYHIGKGILVARDYFAFVAA